MFKALIMGAGSVAASLMIATTASAQTTPADDPANRADLQCMAIAAVGAGGAEEGSVERLGGAVSMAYFLGRLEGRTPSVDWLARFVDYLTGDMETEMKGHVDRCDAEMTRFGDRMTNWGERMQTFSDKQGHEKQGRP